MSKAKGVDATSDNESLDLMKDYCEEMLRKKLSDGYALINKRFHKPIYDDMEEKSILKMEVRIEAR